MNRETRQIYLNLYNIRFFQDFVNANIKWLCYCNNKLNNECRIHIFMKILNNFLSDGSNEKKISNFESFLNEHFSDFFELHHFFQYCLKNVHLSN